MSEFYKDMSQRSSRDVSATLERAYTEAQSMMDRERIDMQSFAAPEGNYDPEMVKKDISLVENLESKFDQHMSSDSGMVEAKHTATVFEAMLSKNVKDSMWFGGNAELIHSSKYDDFVNGVDSILHLKSLGRSDFLALGIDVTFSGKRVEEKIARIKEEIETGAMAKIKYFQLPDKSFKGELASIPRIVLGAESSSVIQMAEQSINNSENSFRKHWMQFQLLEQTIAQCDAFADYARSKEKPNVKAAYEHMGQKIKAIYSLKTRLITLPQDRDRMHKRIIDLLPKPS